MELAGLSLLGLEDLFPGLFTHLVGKLAVVLDESSAASVGWEPWFHSM